MPHSLELPLVLCPVVPLMSGERLAAFGRRIVSELVALALRRTRHRRFTGGCSRLKPRFSGVIRALDDLSKPAAGLRRIQPIRISWRSLDVIDFPARKVRAAHIPFLALAVRRQNECAFARANQNSYLAHPFSPS